MLRDARNYSGSPFVARGKPLVVFIGAEFCPYCAIQVWPLVLVLMRFGNFSNLIYMASAPSEGDYPTFSFLNSVYTSDYLAFQGFEQEDRNGSPLQTVPANYTAVFNQFDSAYPFIDFGNIQVVFGSMFLPNGLAGENWAGVFDEIVSNATTGVQIMESANAIAVLICRLTNDRPSGVCDQSPIEGLDGSNASYGPLPSDLGYQTSWAMGERLLQRTRVATRAMVSQ
jgi:hypothetical protein